MNKKKFLPAMLFFVILLALAGCGAKEAEQEASPEISISEMRSVCELATLECYYHNTAKLDSEKKVLFWNTSKKLWIEYSGIAKLGVDVSKLDMKVDGTTVTIVMPDAEILECKVDETSLSEESFYSETTGLGSGKVGAKEQTEAFAEAQAQMQTEVENDETLFIQAKDRAKLLLENYVKNIGDAIGVAYEVRWDTP
ncbi:DUF4230 domain-containing protein [Lachnospiraceae bacterium 47-T17]